MGEVADETYVPPHEALYHIHLAPVPALPPEKLRVFEIPGQAGDVPDIDDAAIDKVLTVMVAETHVVVFDVPSALTKYVVVTFGEKDGDVPEPAVVPPHEPVYQYQFAPVPKLPPVNVNVEDVPGHIAEGDAEAEEAAIEPPLTIIVTLTQAVVLHNPSGLTKKVVVDAGVCTVETPEHKYEPPQLPLYHIQFACVPRLPPVTDRVEEEPEFIVDGAAVADTATTEVV